MTGKRKKVTFRVNNNGCYICNSHKLNTHGYPSLWANGRNQNMHRVLYEESRGRIKNGLVVRHKCDDRRCINLDHLELGTPKDNSQDCKIRGRLNTPIGIDRSDCKLSDQEVIQIRQSNKFQKELANIYKVSQSTISRIKSKKRRMHVNE